MVRSIVADERVCPALRSLVSLLRTRPCPNAVGTRSAVNAIGRTTVATMTRTCARWTELLPLTPLWTLSPPGLFLDRSKRFPMFTSQTRVPLTAPLSFCAPVFSRGVRRCCAAYVHGQRPSAPPPRAPRRATGSPVLRDDLVEGVVLALRRCVDLMHRLDHEASPAEQPHPVPVRGMELDAAAGPVHLVGLALTAQQALAREPFLGWDTQCRQVAVGHEDQSSSRSQQPGGFRQPSLRVAPRGGSVLTHHKVVPSTGQGDPLPVPLDQREDRSDLGLHPARGHQLLVGEVHGHRPGAGPGQPRGEVRGTARQLHDVETVDLPQNSEVLLRDREEPPDRVRPRPHVLCRRVGEPLVHHRPQRPVQRLVGVPDLGHPIMR